MSDEFEITIPVVRGEGVGVPIGEIQRAINSICQQVQTDLNLIASGGFPLTDVDITGGTITGVAISNSTGVTQPTTDNSTLLATDAFVNQQIIRSTETVPITLTGGVYNQATLGTGFSPVIFASGGVVQSILTIVNPGSGYAVGDLITLAGGNDDATLRVATLSGSGVASVTVLYGGTGYTTGVQVMGTPIPPGDRNVVFTGTLTSNVTFIIAAGTYNSASRRPSFANNTTGNFTVTVFLSNGADGTTGTGYILPQGTANSTSVLLQTDGETGVWPVTALVGQITQAPTGQFYANQGAHIDRLNDRVFVGGATVNAGNPDGVGTQDWLEQLRAFSTSIAQEAVLSTIGQIAVVAGTRTSDSPNAGSMGAIGYEAITNNDNAAEVQYAWGAYLEARRQVGAGTTLGLEIDTANYGPTVDFLPYSGIPTGITPGLWLAAGAGLTGINPSTVAIGIIPNGTTWERGITFQAGSLNGDAIGPATAIAMATSHRVEWYDINNSISGYITSTATTNSKPTGITFTDGAFEVTNLAGSPIASVANVAGSVNYGQLIPSVAGTAVTFCTQGSDTSIGLILSPKGSGSVSMGSGAFVPAQTAGIVGTTTNNNANAGSVGEYVTATGTAVSLTNNTPANCTSISLTAGDWDVYGSALFNPAGTTTTNAILVGISTTSATTPAAPLYSILGLAAPAGVGNSLVAPSQRISLASTTTVYLVTNAIFAVSTMTVTGQIWARRRR